LFALSACGGEEGPVPEAEFAVRQQTSPAPRPISGGLSWNWRDPLWSRWGARQEGGKNGGPAQNYPLRFRTKTIPHLPLKSVPRAP